MNEELLTASDILGSLDATYKDVEVPEWTPKAMREAGQFKKIRLQCMSAGEAIDFTKLSNDPNLRDEAMIKIIALTAVDHNGKKLFRDEDLKELRKKNFDVINRLQKDALEVCGFGKKDAVAQAKNASGEATSAASPTA